MRVILILRSVQSIGYYFNIFFLYRGTLTVACYICNAWYVIFYEHTYFVMQGCYQEWCRGLSQRAESLLELVLGSL